MLWLKWLPWRLIIRRVALAHGFLDPVMLLSRLHRFGQPSEVAVPIELLRAGVVLHARGLINSRVIQHNLDWVWPYWVERQFDPGDEAFVPRAFSLTHINLTNRNWTAIGLPDCSQLPIVDPRGLLTPFFDGWSLDGWILTADGQALLPSRLQSSTQRLDLADSLVVITETYQDGLSLVSQAEVQLQGKTPVCRMKMEAYAETDGWAIVALRPYNPEGISFIHEVALSADRINWTVDGLRTVKFSVPVDRHHVSHFRSGDVYIHLGDLDDKSRDVCPVGMATAAALFELKSHEPRHIIATIPLTNGQATISVPTSTWNESLSNHCKLQIPDEDFLFLYEAALRTLILHSPGEVYPGPYTYKRFWFRDAAFILHALLCLGLTKRVERALDRFPARQNVFGYFHSQNGEWDSNGEALWIIRRYCELTQRPPKHAWRKSIYNGARWICNKRISDDHGSLHAGLLPAGFSAEHLGPTDYYYWDDFWGVAGLQAAAYLAGSFGDKEARQEFHSEADGFWHAIDRSLTKVSERLHQQVMPASPYRRLDSGAIGSLAVGYPLQICEPDDSRLLNTVNFLLDNCFVDGAFFQDMIHSGINPYLTLHVAQVLLRAGDSRYLELMKSVARLSSPTGQWPEAIHPHTSGGCMGDGQHAWAAAEWVLMIRNCFVREEGERLILASGISPRWLKNKLTLSFGPAPTSFGTVHLSIEPKKKKIVVSWQGTWHAAPPDIEVRLPGFGSVTPEGDQCMVEFDRGAEL